MGSPLVIVHNVTPPVPVKGGFIDRIRVEKIGLVRVEGWSAISGYFPNIRVISDNVQIAEHTRYKTYRPDVVSQEGVHDRFCGFCIEFDAGRINRNGTRTIRVVEAENGTVAVLDHERLRCEYGFLLKGNSVFKRCDLYKSAAKPPSTVSPEVIELLLQHRGPMLDFGCGSGIYVQKLRKMGINVRGVDLDIYWVRRGIPLHIRPFIHLYDGKMPLKYQDGSFRTVFCIESLEHIDNFKECVQEISRITSETAIFTVPDIEAIPICSADYVVPWHMLEAQHVNFFTQKNLHKLLMPHFSTIHFVRLHPHIINGSMFYGNICAICRK